MVEILQCVVFRVLESNLQDEINSRIIEICDEHGFGHEGIKQVQIVPVQNSQALQPEIVFDPEVELEQEYLVAIYYVVPAMITRNKTTSTTQPSQ